MTLTRHAVDGEPRLAVDGRLLPAGLTLGYLLGLSPKEMRGEMSRELESTSQPAGDAALLAPAESDQEVWAAGVTYLRSRVEREAESIAADVYAKVYEADRPEIFFKATGWRTVGHGGPIRVRKDSGWDVPEPELTLVVNRHLEIVGYTAGNDVSSRSIEGENPLYLPQAKTYDGSCALGPGIVLADEAEMSDLPIHLSVMRGTAEVFAGDARTSQMKRSLSELVEFLARETSFPRGAFLMTGTGIVPTPDFTLLPGDVVSVSVGELQLVNTVST
jgi:2-dehydro-3-deoxy-D-arabinonate dehydratase